MNRLFLLLILAVTLNVQADEPVRVKVTGDRVSLRAKPDINSELLDRAMRDDEMIFFEKTNGWVAVQAPDSLNFWVAGEYIRNDNVVPAKLNVRSGPSLNYTVVNVLNQGDAVASRGEFTSWLMIAPPEGSRVWISEKYVDVIEPPKPPPEPEPAPVVEPEKIKAAVPVIVSSKEVEEEKELKPLVLVLDESKKQGKREEIPGVLRRANPGLYKLVLIAGDIEEPICLVRGNEKQMEQYLNRSLLIKGRSFWAVDVDLPVIVPDKIHLDPILKD